MQKITPSLWFDANAEEAMNFYTGIFNNSKILRMDRYPDGFEEGPMAGMAGKIINGEFEIEGMKFICLDGGPLFKFTPAISFFVNLKTSEEVDDLWAKLVDGGKVLMDLGKYDFSEKYGWLEDKFGLSWQINVSGAPDVPVIVPSFMFAQEQAGKAEEAINYYAEVFKNAKVGDIYRYPAGSEPDKEGTVMYADFTLENQRFAAMDSAQDHLNGFNEAISMTVDCVDQEEVDYYWNKLSAVPEAEQCGWLKDKYGVAWQIIPRRLGELLGDPDEKKSRRVLEAMLQMHKIVVEDLEKAARGE